MINTLPTSQQHKNTGIDHIYVVHAPKGYEKHEKRLYHIITETFGYDFEFLGKDSIDLIPIYFIPEIDSIMNRPTQLCTLNHILFYQRIIDNNDNVALILEDDPYFSTRFTSYLQRIVKESQGLPPGFLISLENSTLKFPSRKIIRKGQYLYPAEFGRCAGAYLIDRTAAQNIINRLKTRKCEQTIDHWHNKLIRENIFKMYWAHPTCVEQGSLNGKISSNNSTRMAGFTRRISWISQKFYKQYFLRLFQ